MLIVNYSLNQLLRIWISLISVSAIYYLFDWLLPDYESRFYGLQINFILLFIIFYVLAFYIAQISCNFHQKSDFFILVIIIIINLILGFSLFTNDYLASTLDFQPHITLINNIKVVSQPFMGTIIDGRPGYFYPLGSLYIFAPLSSFINIEVFTLLKYGYISTCAIFWPLIFWQYLNSFKFSDLTRSKIFIVGITLNHFPFGYFYWGHWPTVQAILFAVFIDGTLIKKLSIRKSRDLIIIFITMVIALTLHPVGLGTVIALLMIRLMSYSQYSITREKIVNYLKSKFLITVFILSTLGFFFILRTNSIYAQVNENWMKLIKGTTFVYETTIYERLFIFIYEWIVNLKYHNNFVFDVFFFVLLVSFILYYSSIKDRLTLLIFVLIILSTAAAQQPFPFSLIAVPTFLFYSSPSRISHLLIIVLALILGFSLDGYKKIGYIYSIFLKRNVLMSYFLVSSILFYISI